jgi:hypothetical protein
MYDENESKKIEKLNYIYEAQQMGVNNHDIQIIKVI